MYPIYERKRRPIVVFWPTATPLSWDSSQNLNHTPPPPNNLGLFTSYNFTILCFNRALFGFLHGYTILSCVLLVLTLLILCCWRAEWWDDFAPPCLLFLLCKPRDGGGSTACLGGCWFSSRCISGHIYFGEFDIDSVLVCPLSLTCIVSIVSPPSFLERLSTFAKV